MAHRYLICNADDFGLGRRISDAILHCHAHGIVSSTTVMANMPAAEYACDRAREFPDLGVGVHLVLTAGRPVLPAREVPNLVDSDGGFLSPSALKKVILGGRSLVCQAEREFAAQIHRAASLGITPTHCDSHHGIHQLPWARAAMVRAMRQFGLLRVRPPTQYYWTAPSAPMSLRIMRIRHNIRFWPQRIRNRWNSHMLRRAGLRSANHKFRPSMLLPQVADPRDRLPAALRSLPAGIAEIAFHPGYPDPEVADPPAFAGVREKDFALVSNPASRSAAQQEGIELVSYLQV